MPPSTLFASQTPRIGPCALLETFNTCKMLVIFLPHLVEIRSLVDILFSFRNLLVGGGGGDSIVWGLNSCQYGLWLMKPWKSRHVGYNDWFQIEIVLVTSLFYLGRCTISLKWLLCLCYFNIGYLVSRLPKIFITLKWNYYTINKVLHVQHFHVGFLEILIVYAHLACGKNCQLQELPQTS